MGIRTTEFSRLNVQEWLIHLVHVSPTPTFKLSLMILWMIWKRVKTKQRWKKPEDGWIKLNFDGEWEEMTKCCGVELIATISAAIVAQQLGLSGKWCMFERDSVVIIAAVNGEGEDFSPLTPIINDVRVLINDFSQIKFYHVKREANQVAHRLARTGMSCS
ncbi:hypothetical protein ACFX13_000370 [Malus domestica]